MKRDQTFQMELDALTHAGAPPGETHSARIAPTLPVPPKPDAPNPGAHGTAAPWEPGELLGRGGMGTVHAARDTVLARVVAIKRPLAATHGQALVAEARTLAQLDHPNVVPVHALVTDEAGAPVVVMKRVDGRRWSDILREGRDLERDVEVAIQLTAALRYAHARSIYHLDIKPDNVMVGPFGEVYLMDWGCSASGENLTTTSVVGTPAYFAPEMLQEGARLGASTDVFLLGATLHRAVTGAPRNVGGDIREVLEAARVARPAEYPPEVPGDLAAILNRACAPAPEDRYTSVDDLATALRGFLRHREAAALADATLARGHLLDTALESGAPAAVAAIWEELRTELRTSLRVWPDNQRARAGLEALGVRHLASQLDRGELSLAEATLDCLLPANRAVWAPRIAAARAAQATRDATAHAHDLNVAARDRLVAAAIVLVGVLSGGVVVETWFAVGGVDATELVYIGAMSSLVILGAMAATRRALTRSPVSMKVFTALAAMSFGSIVHRLLGWYTQTPVHTTLQVELVWFWCLLGIVGLFSEPGLLLSGLPFLAAALGVALRPERAVEIFSAGMGVSAVISYAVMHRRARGAGASDGTGP